jgi:hypothetical protein
MIIVVLQETRSKSLPLVYLPMILRSFIRMRMKKSTNGSSDPLITSLHTGNRRWRGAVWRRQIERH